MDRLNHDLPFIAESKEYVCFVDNIEEAYYISSFLNSSFANLIIKDFQTRGLFGARDVHTKILDVPLSRYDENNKNHLRVAKLGLACQNSVQKYISSNEIDKKDYNVGKLRLQMEYCSHMN